jgi:hypothetical protein
MYYCCRCIGIEWSTSKYCLLGDDILIGDSALAEKYKEVILSLGVDFSPLKTHESEFLAEFAKRYIYKGEEITPFPISSLKECSRKFYLLVPLIHQEARKGWDFASGMGKTVSEYYRIVLGFPSSYCKGIELKSAICATIMDSMSGKMLASDALNFVTGKLSLPYKKLDEETANGMLQHQVACMFASSNPEYLGAPVKRGRPLGESATNLFLRMTG